MSPHAFGRSMRSGSQRVVQLPASVFEVLVSWSRNEAPREACGLLTGRRGPNGVEVTHAHRGVNLDPRPDRFELDPATLIRVDREAEARGEQVLAVWHSHPGRPAALSALDRAGVPQTWSQAVLALGERASAELVWYAGGESAWRPVARWGC